MADKQAVEGGNHVELAQKVADIMAPQDAVLSSRLHKALAECREFEGSIDVMGPRKMVSMAELHEMGLVSPCHSATGLIDGWVPTQAGRDFPL